MIDLTKLFKLTKETGQVQEGQGSTASYTAEKALTGHDNTTQKTRTRPRRKSVIKVNPGHKQRTMQKNKLRAEPNSNKVDAVPVISQLDTAKSIDPIPETPVPSTKSAIVLQRTASILSPTSAPSIAPVQHSNIDPIDGTTTPIQATAPPIVLNQNGSDKPLSNGVLGNEPLERIEVTTIANTSSSQTLPPIDTTSLEEPCNFGETIPEPEVYYGNNSLPSYEGKSYDILIAELNQAHTTIAIQSKRISELEGICKERTESEWEAQVRRLKRQLENAGIQVAVNMNYDEIKEKMKVIAASMGELEGGPIVEHPNLKIQAQLRRKYFDLELEMDKLYSAMVASDEYEVEMKEKESTWHRNNIEASREALIRVRNCIPVHVSTMTTEVLANELHLHKNAVAYAKRLKSLKALNLLRMNPQKLRVLHPCELVQVSFSKLSILEKKALYGAVTDLADEWNSQPSNMFFAKKHDWFKSLRNTLMQEMLTLEVHLQPEHKCTLGSQCPASLQAKLDMFYEIPCIFTKGSEFPQDGDVIPMAAPVVKPTQVEVTPSSPPNSKTMHHPPPNVLQAIKLRKKIE
ncbi:hypothetical protein THRCLA_10673 [Thraustotheca clavata]|uniref:Uncharacterized protein n=1 Tax=Thraustotheca clavata TaxID=74557 RepID=A0A1V9YIJ8_9STRA|nr:hypothetical protein THRCLA_10673 [Thraustotheca clavata]